MKNIKKFNEASQSDMDNLRFLIGLIHKKLPRFEVNMNGMRGEIRNNGTILFETNGGSSFDVIFAYVSGVVCGLSK